MYLACPAADLAERAPPMSVGLAHPPATEATGKQKAPDMPGPARPVIGAQEDAPRRRDDSRRG
ncbi:hypothetical protein KRMM14A1259_20430 [Krasilnikovia sp. MM14-A1259]